MGVHSGDICTGSSPWDAPEDLAGISLGPGLVSRGEDPDWFGVASVV